MKEAFPIVDGCRLSAELQSLLRPSERRQDGRGHWHELPRFFYQIDSWEEARQAKLTPHFTLSELLAVDCREAGPLLRGFPHYAPCAVGVLARYLEEFRTRVGAPVFVSVNGGYRSPAHRYSSAAGPHQWATAADIYRIGDHWLANVDVKWAILRANVKYDSATIAQVRVDPALFAVGLGYRF